MKTETVSSLPMRSAHLARQEEGPVVEDQAEREAVPHAVHLQKKLHPRPALSPPLSQRPNPYRPKHPPLLIQKRLLRLMVRPVKQPRRLLRQISSNPLLAASAACSPALPCTAEWVSR